MLKRVFAVLKSKFPSLSNANLDNKNYQVRSISSNSGWLFIFKKIIIWALYLPLYLAFVFPLLIIGSARYFMLSKSDKKQIKKYCQEFWYFPSLCIHKSIEGKLFSEAEIKSPSADIGCEDGRVSRLHFSGHVFDTGVEMIQENLPNIPIYKEVINGSLPDLPLPMMHNYKTVVFVHVLDHIQDYNQALQGIKKIMHSSGSKLMLSAFADGYQNNVQKYSLGLLGEKWLNDKKGCWHFFTINQWINVFEECGFKVNHIQGFLCGVRGVLWTVLLTFFESNGSNDIYYSMNKLDIIPFNLKKIFCIVPVTFLTALFYSTKDSSHPCNFYAELELR